ncbi:hypothetical protein PPTG_22380 [Phytophthora nicotianae INRA-310]|uniref:Crinkler effector protein N-terminal domain-containing protein n=1 Tax=Phytophthora nicotianae (strain INRA-310) TaxID=761204 RepID=W2QK35_PHYN3|nr:hypothetical protein PPTG_22380 [Phytophthora nicotianae INRA-310]ETN12615.1 hypothetical protein PPTG_22380 [Phytophthora nicotianae INRA-310]
MVNQTNIKCAATNLKLFLVKKSDAWLPHNENLDMLLQSKIDTSSYLRMRGSWKLSRPELFGPGVSLDEFRLDSLSTTRQSVDPIVMTPTVHKIWKGFGEFPPYYFVRMEQVVFWKVIKKLLFGEDRVVIVGSPSVGKSCFLMLLPFYRVFRKEKDEAEDAKNEVIEAGLRKIKRQNTPWPKLVKKQYFYSGGSLRSASFHRVPEHLEPEAN